MVDAHVESVKSGLQVMPDGVTADRSTADFGRYEKIRLAPRRSAQVAVPGAQTAGLRVGTPVWLCLPISSCYQQID